MIDEKLKRYIDRGVSKGFNIDFLKASLRKHGHDPLAIDLAARQFQEEKVPVSKVEVVKKDERSSAIIFGLGIIIVVLFAFIIIQNIRPGATTAAIQCEPQVKTLEVCEGAVSKMEAQKRLDDISSLEIEINKKQAEIDKRLSEIEVLDASVEEKETIIRAQVEELKKISERMKDERSKIKVLLMQLLNSILQG